MAKDNPVLFGGDEGNTGGKNIVFEISEDGKSASMRESYIPHGFMRLDEEDWSREQSSAAQGKRQQSQTHTFQIASDKTSKDESDWVWETVKFGKAAVIGGDNQILLGAKKYIPGYFDAYLVAAFCEMFPKGKYPKGHDNIHLAIGVPSADYVHHDKVMALSNKTHLIIDPDGSRRKFVVRQTMTVDENEGGAMRAMSHLLELRKSKNPPTNQDGKFFSVQGRLALLDCGGFLGSAAAGEIINGIPTVDSTRTYAINSGIVRVREALRDLLKSKYTDELGDIPHNNLDDIWIDNVIKNRAFTISGMKVNYSAEKQVKEAVQAYTKTLKTVWSSGFDNGKLIDTVIITGGTAGVLRKEIIEAIGHNNVIFADYDDAIYRANSRGMLDILAEKLLSTGKMPSALEPHIATEQAN